jgi:hypothetical protein
MYKELIPLCLLGLTVTGCVFDKDDDTADTNDSEPEDTDTDSDDTEPTPTETTLDPDYLLFSLMNGYVGNAVSPVIIPGATDPIAGAFSAILFDSTSGDFCAIDWDFDSTNTEADPEFADGLVPDKFSTTGGELEAWYGFIITGSTPTTRGSCDILSEGFEQIYQGLLADSPGFGYGPLTADFQEAMSATTDGHPEGWEVVEPYVFTGIVTNTSLEQDGSRRYMGINQAYLYPITDGTTVYDPANTADVQGTEILAADAAYAEGFYNSSYYYGLVFQ